MDICIFGAGAIGGNVAARLIGAGDHRVSLVARGPHLAAIRARGLELQSEGETMLARPLAATDVPDELPPQDVVFVTLKAPSLPGAADAVAALLKPDGCAVMLGNGIPYWWDLGRSGGTLGLPLLDPQGDLVRAIGPDRVVGGIVYSANEAVAPGIIRHTFGNRWIFGEPDDAPSARVAAIVAALNAGGLRAEAATDIRQDIWVKLLRNASQNPICALTRLEAGRVARDAELVALANRVIDEIVAIAGAGGWDVAAEADKVRLKYDPDAAPGTRPSMLQDVLGGRAMEVDAILGQPQLFARAAGLATPAIDAVLTLLRGLNASLRPA